MISLPATSTPTKYEGLYAFDFGDHVNLGYTAGEIQILHNMFKYRKAKAYEVYRVDNAGRFELRGVASVIRAAPEAICFLRTEGSVARRDYEEIKKIAADYPPPCGAELRLGRSYAFEPPDLTALVFPAWAAHGLGCWLEQRGLSPGDTVAGGPDALARLDADGGITIASHTLVSSASADRPVEELLRTVDIPLQR